MVAERDRQLDPSELRAYLRRLYRAICWIVKDPHFQGQWIFQ